MTTLALTHVSRLDQLFEQVGTIVRRPLRWVRRAPLRRIIRRRLAQIRERVR